MFSIKQLFESKQYNHFGTFNINFTQELKDNFKIIVANEYSVCDFNTYSMIKKNKELTNAEKLSFLKMLNYFCNHNERNVYRRTDYLCDDERKICIENNYAKIMNKYRISPIDGSIIENVNYKPDEINVVFYVEK